MIIKIPEWLFEQSQSFTIDYGYIGPKWIVTLNGGSPKERNNTGFGETIEDAANSAKKHRDKLKLENI